MKKSFLLMLMAILGVMGARSQTVLYQDDFESYAVGSYLAVDNPTWWTTWENLPGTAQDAQISDAYGHSATKSFNVNSTGGNTDLILKLGDRTSGSYELSWWMYVEAPNAAYYNVQHYESPGTQWAYDVYFYVSGSGALLVGNDSVNFNYPKATWFQVKQLINLNMDSTFLYVNGVLVSQWPFHYTTNNINGVTQLGGVDFFSESTTYNYYVDDLLFTELSPPTNPVIAVTPDSISNWMAQGSTQSVPLYISNSGMTTLLYNVIVMYDSIQNLGLPSDTGTLQYDTDNASAIGWNTVPTTITVAARYTPDMTSGFAGMKVTAVDVYIYQINTSGSNEMTVKIWGMGTAYEPGALLYQQNFTPTGGSWEHIVLTNPVFVSGGDLWVGYTFTQTTAGIFIPGVDAGPANPNGDFLSTGAGWSHLSENPALNYNWNIRAKLEGSRIPQWLTVVPDSGNVISNGTDTLQVTFSNDSLIPGRYTATIRVLSNDPETGFVDVPVVLDIVGVGVRNISGNAVQVYPNPVTDRLFISADQKIGEVAILDLSGKTVITGKGNMINVNNLPPGVYLLQTNTASGLSVTRFVKM